MRILSALLALVMIALPGMAFARAAKGGKAGAARAGRKAAASAKVVPDQAGKIVVFPFKGDDEGSIGALIERLLRARGLEVVTGVRPVDTPEQYRELAGTLGLIAFIDGSLKEGESSARLTVQVRSGYSGGRTIVTTFKETKLHLRTEVEDKLWTKVGPTMTRAAVDATKPRKRGRGPLVIEAGTPLTSRDASGP